MHFLARELTYHLLNKNLELKVSFHSQHRGRINFCEKHKILKKILQIKNSTVTMTKRDAVHTMFCRAL